MARRYKLVSKADLKDYRAWLDWYGYSEDDFQLSERADPPETRGEQKHPTGCVRVYRKSANITRNYRTGVGLRWTVDLEDDLRRGAFKPR
ncbi:MAG: hypothetical protein V3V96_08675 [Acidiferrobacterales bacterium]